MLLPEDPQMFGWHKLCQSKKSVKDYEACVNKNVYSFKETVPIAVGHFNHTSKIIKEGRLVCLKPLPGSIQYSGNNQTFSLYLNASKTYFVAFVDPKFQLVSGNPTAFPKTIMKISATAGTLLIYLKVRCEMSSSMTYYSY